MVKELPFVGVDENGDASDNRGNSKEIHVYAHPGEKVASEGNVNQKTVKGSQSMKTVPTDRKDEHYRVRSISFKSRLDMNPKC